MEGKLINVYNREKVEPRLNEQQRKKLQHEIKIYMEQYFK